MHEPANASRPRISKPHIRVTSTLEIIVIQSSFNHTIRPRHKELHRLPGLANKSNNFPNHPELDSRKLIDLGLCEIPGTTTIK